MRLWGLKVASRQREGSSAVMPFHALTLALVAPPLAGGLLLLFFDAWPIGLPLVVSILAPSYFIGGVPAFLAGRLDAALAVRGWSALRRLGCVAVLAGATGATILPPLYVSGRIHGVLPLLLPAALALSAVLALGFNMALARIVFANDRQLSEGNER